MDMKKRPNILLIVTDDQCYDTISAMGNPNIRTPNIDSLVNNGFAFERHFCTTPICTPARAEILTGCSSFHNHVPWFNMSINPELELLPQTMQKSDYHTVHVGKWHNNGHPRDKGYDITRRVFAEDNLNDMLEKGHYMRFEEENGEVEGHSTELFTDAAAEEIVKAPEDKPWFCFLGYFAPHDPHHSPPPFDTMYSPDNMPLPNNFMPEHPYDNGAMIIRDEFLETWPRRHDAIKKYRSRYYGIISHLDHNIGRLIGKLKTKGDLDNTVIIFTGDQGLAAGSHGLLGKESMYDHSIASPLILCGPGITAGGRSRAMSHHTDLYPTICDLARIDRPRSASDGFSLMPIIKGEKEDIRDAVFCEFCMPRAHNGQLHHVQRAVRTKRWKLIWYAECNMFQLFDLERDAEELVNLLAPWRLRHWRLLKQDPGYNSWQTNRWAPVDFKPEYSYSQIMDTAAELWKKMRQLMDENNDPLEASQRPDCLCDTSIKNTV
jgi:arylsulfatase A-like enzyme